MSDYKVGQRVVIETSEDFFSNFGIKRLLTVEVQELNDNKALVRTDSGRSMMIDKVNILGISVNPTELKQVILSRKEVEIIKYAVDIALNVGLPDLSDVGADIYDVHDLLCKVGCTIDDDGNVAEIKPKQ